MAEITERSWTETISAEGGALLEEVSRLVHEGNVRRIVIKQGAWREPSSLPGSPPLARLRR
jgi:hypothetical protein